MMLGCLFPQLAQNLAEDQYQNLTAQTQESFHPPLTCSPLDGRRGVQKVLQKEFKCNDCKITQGRNYPGLWGYRLELGKECLGFCNEYKRSTPGLYASTVIFPLQLLYFTGLKDTTLATQAQSFLILRWLC